MSDTRLIQLTSGKSATVDAEDHDRLAHWSWWFDGRYAYRKVRPVGVKGRRGLRKVYMHREIVGAEAGDVDHANGDTLDNRKSNLRACSRSKNNMNQRPTGRGSSKYKGVSWRKDMGCWEINIQRDGRKRRVGYSADEEDAARMYDVAAKEAFGEYARTNF